MPPLQRKGKGLRKAALDAATTEEGKGLRKAALDAATTEEGGFLVYPKGGMVS